MKSLLTHINEAKKVDPNVDPISFIENSPEFYSSRQQFIDLYKGNVSMFYHGTNSDFKKFDTNKGKDFRNDQFFGDGLFITPEWDTAYKYANANVNNSLDISLLDKAKKVNKLLGSFMSDLFYKGNSSWRDEKHQKFYDWLEKADIKVKDLTYSIDANEIAEIVNLIPDSQSAKDYGRDTDQDEIMDMFSSNSSALGDHIINTLSALGLGDYSPRILTVGINGKDAEIFMTSSSAKAKKSKADIIIIYNNKDLVDGKPELIVKDEKRTVIIKSETV